MITIGTARQRAAEWVREHACMQADYIGAYFSGSTVGRPEKEALPTGSDVDVVVVLRGETVPPKPGKTIYKDTLIEITYLLQSAGFGGTSVRLLPSGGQFPPACGDR
ncbi:hypothetical protein CM49_01334 [Paenibacillus sp. P1XP2]|nr:hypothetical protein CM49_01334 [Paenibacillus sp. P1XP2]